MGDLGDSTWITGYPYELRLIVLGMNPTSNHSVLVGVTYRRRPARMSSIRTPREPNGKHSQSETRP